MLDGILVEQIAKLLFEHEGGMTNADFKECTGEERKLWKLAATTDGPDPDYVITEWQRDEYRHQAREVLRYLSERNLLRLSGT